MDRIMRVGLGIGAVLCAFATPAMAAPVANVVEVVNYATHQPVGQDKLQVYLKDALYQDEVLETAADARLKVVFVDGSEFELEGGSQAILDKFLYDAEAGKTDMAISLGAGVFRFVSGNTDDSGTTFETPTATVGIRGTAIQIAVGTEGWTQVSVYDGAVEIRPCGGKKPRLANPGQRAHVNARCDVSITNLPKTVPGPMDINTQEATAAPEAPATSDNRSGHADATNPGNGDVNSNSNNGGSNNPGNGGSNNNGNGNGHL